MPQTPSTDFKFPGPSTLERTDLTNNPETPFPIASVSKAFCGMVCTLMAVDGKFGENGINTTLKKVLEDAKSNYPNRAENINKYLEMLENRGFSDVKISELLTHRSGCKDNDELAPSSCEGQTPLKFFSDNLGRGKNQRGQHNYSNNGYTLLEEIINLVSEKGGYKEELKERIISKLDLKNTGFLEDSSDPKSHEAGQHLGKGILIPGSNQNPHSDKIVQTRTEFPANHTTPLGPVHASCGGLYASVEDLNIVALELVKMIASHPNSLTNKASEVSSLYREQIKEGNHYSLGVEIKPILVDGEQCTTISHTGQFPGNFAKMEVMVPCRFEELFSGKITLDDKELNTNIFMQKTDYLVPTHFTEQAETIPNKMLKKFVNSRLNDDEKKQFSEEKSYEKAMNYLIKNGRLPPDFLITRDGIMKDFDSKRGEVKEFLKENYLKVDGVIDSKKLAKDFPTTKEVDEIIQPIFAPIIDKVEKILSKISQQESQRAPSSSLQPSPRNSVEAAASVGGVTP